MQALTIIGAKEWNNFQEEYVTDNLLADAENGIIAVKGHKFDLEDLKQLSQWIEHYLLTHKVPPSLKYLNLPKSNLFYMRNFPLPNTNEKWIRHMKPLTLDKFSSGTSLPHFMPLRKTLSSLHHFSFMIESTNFTPKLVADFKKGKVQINGRLVCYQYEGFLFLEPLVAWIDTYFSVLTKPLKLCFCLDYCSTEGSKALWEFFQFLLEKDRRQLKIFWYYIDEDEDMKKTGEDFKTLLELPDHMFIVKEFPCEESN